MTTEFNAARYGAGNTLLDGLLFRLPPTTHQVETQLLSIRGRMRRYTAQSIAINAYQSLNANYGKKFDELRAAPWLSILLAKWALQDQRIAFDSGDAMPLALFDKLRQELWELQGQASIALGATAAQLFRNAFNVQLDFQRQQPFSFLRWPALIEALAPAHEMRRMFLGALEMEPQAYADHALAVFAAAQENRHGVPLTFFDPITKLHGEATQKFFALVAHDFRSLRDALQSKDASRVDGIGELFQSPYLKRYPLLRDENQTVRGWHPMVVARGMEDIVHLKLSDVGQRYPQLFSKIFEAHVVRQLYDAGVSYINERQLKAAFGKDSSSVEAVIECRGCNVLIESKMSLFWDDVLVSDSPTDAFIKTKHVRKAIFQGVRVGELIRSARSPFAERAKEKIDYLLVVTSRELNIGGGKTLERLLPEGSLTNIYPEGDSEPIPFPSRGNLSPERIFILSIEEYERLLGTIARGRIDLEEILQHAASCNSTPQTAHMYFSDYLKQFAQDGWPTPRLMGEFWDATRQRLERILTSSQ